MRWQALSVSECNLCIVSYRIVEDLRSTLRSSTTIEQDESVLGYYRHGCPQTCAKGAPACRLKRQK